MAVFYRHDLIYQASAPTALLDEPAAAVDSDPFSQNPGPTLRGRYHEGGSEPMVEEVPTIGSGWFDDAPPVVFPRPRSFESESEAKLFADEVAAPGVDMFTESPGPVLRPGFFESPSAITEEDVPPIASGWFMNPPDIVERIPLHLGAADVDWTDVPLIGSGWFDDAPRIVYPRPKYFESITDMAPSPGEEGGAAADDSMQTIFFDFPIIYQGSAPTALTDVPEIGSGWYTNLVPAPPRTAHFEGASEPMVLEVPDIGSGWYHDAPHLVQPRPRYFQSVTDFVDNVVVVVLGDLVFTESPGPTLRIPGETSRTDFDLTDVPLIGSGWFANPPQMVFRPRYHESSSQPMVEEVPPIGSGWFSNPPPMVLRPFVALPGEPPGDLEEAVAVEDVFSEGPYLLLRRPFYDSVVAPMVEDVPEIGSGWFTNPPPVILRPGYFPSLTDSAFDIPGVALVLKSPLTATLIHTGQSMAVEVTSGILKVDLVESIVEGFAFLVHQGNLVAEEITDGTQKAEEC